MNDDRRCKWLEKVVRFVMVLTALYLSSIIYYSTIDIIEK